MKKLLFSIIFLLFSSSSFSNELNPSIYGYWINNDSEILIIQTNNTFSRKSKTETLAKGKLEIINDKIYVLRTDSDEEYSLEYYLGEETLVVKKPNSNEAWLFTRIGD